LDATAVAQSFDDETTATGHSATPRAQGDGLLSPRSGYTSAAVSPRNSAPVSPRNNAPVSPRNNNVENTTMSIQAISTQNPTTGSGIPTSNVTRSSSKRSDSSASNLHSPYAPLSLLQSFPLKTYSLESFSFNNWYRKRSVLLTLVNLKFQERVRHHKNYIHRIENEKVEIERAIFDVRINMRKQSKLANAKKDADKDGRGKGLPKTEEVEADFVPEGFGKKNAMDFWEGILGSGLPLHALGKEELRQTVGADTVNPNFAFLVSEREVEKKVESGSGDSGNGDSGNGGNSENVGKEEMSSSASNSGSASGSAAGGETAEVAPGKLGGENGKAEGNGTNSNDNGINGNDTEISSGEKKEKGNAHDNGKSTYATNATTDTKSAQETVLDSVLAPGMAFYEVANVQRKSLLARSEANLKHLRNQSVSGILGITGGSVSRIGGPGEEDKLEVDANGDSTGDKKTASVDGSQKKTTADSEDSLESAILTGYLGLEEDAFVKSDQRSTMDILNNNLSNLNNEFTTENSTPSCVKASEFGMTVPGVISLIPITGFKVNYGKQQGLDSSNSGSSSGANHHGGSGKTGVGFEDAEGNIIPAKSDSDTTADDDSNLATKNLLTIPLEYRRDQLPEFEHFTNIKADFFDGESKATRGRPKFSNRRKSRSSSAQASNIHAQDSNIHAQDSNIHAQDSNIHAQDSNIQAEEAKPQHQDPQENLKAAQKPALSHAQRKEKAISDRIQQLKRTTRRKFDVTENIVVSGCSCYGFNVGFHSKLAAEANERGHFLRWIKTVRGALREVEEEYKVSGNGDGKGKVGIAGGDEDGKDGDSKTEGGKGAGKNSAKSIAAQKSNTRSFTRSFTTKVVEEDVFDNIEMVHPDHITSHKDEGGSGGAATAKELADKSLRPEKIDTLSVENVLANLNRSVNSSSRGGNRVIDPFDFLQFGLSKPVFIRYNSLLIQDIDWLVSLLVPGAKQLYGSGDSSTNGGAGISERTLIASGEAQDENEKDVKDVTEKVKKTGTTSSAADSSAGSAMPAVANSRFLFQDLLVNLRICAEQMVRTAVVLLS
jgi:hypothetical protein